ncbi:MAG: hypothetical protein [Bacteriophage sp.]|nr:MAG: hypothetical protein [Bacteriophage sp.]
MELLVILGLILLLGGSGQGIGAVSRGKLVRPYINGKLNPELGLKPNAKQIGVYLIYENGRPVYIGYSGSQLYKTFTRHFQSWDDPHQVRITYTKIQAEGMKARVAICNTAKQAAALEKALILKYKPRDNPSKYNDYVTSKYDNQQLTEYSQGDAPF